MHRREYERFWRNATRGGRAASDSRYSRARPSTTPEGCPFNVWHAVLGNRSGDSLRVFCTLHLFAAARRRLFLAARMVDRNHVGHLGLAYHRTSVRNAMLA